MQQKHDQSKLKTIVGIRPTGQLHLGHYFSVIKPAIEEKADVLIASYHVPKPDKEIYPVPFAMEKELKRFGLNPKFQIINEDLYFSLLSASRMAELRRLTQYHHAAIKTPHLLMYPILMAHDLVGYDRVIVGDDQRQHVEYANILFKRLKLPHIKGDFRGGRVMSLTTPTKKMSKSEPKGCLFLDDSPEVIQDKIRKANTCPEGVANLLALSLSFGGGWEITDNQKSKENLSSLIISELARYS